MDIDGIEAKETNKAKGKRKKSITDEQRVKKKKKGTDIARKSREWWQQVNCASRLSCLHVNSSIVRTK